MTSDEAPALVFSLTHHCDLRVGWMDCLKLIVILCRCFHRTLSLQSFTDVRHKSQIFLSVNIHSKAFLMFRGKSLWIGTIYELFQLLVSKVFHYEAPLRKLSCLYKKFKNLLTHNLHVELFMELKAVIFK